LGVGGCEGQNRRRPTKEAAAKKKTSVSLPYDDNFWDGDGDAVALATAKVHASVAK
jgi:hypothetical protein